MTAARKASPTLAAGALHQRIRTELEDNIVAGRWPPGYRIPFEHELTETYACSRMTVNKVLSGLAADGLIERHRRVGSFVTRPKVQAAVLHIPDIKAEIELRNELYGYELLSDRRRRGTKSDLARLGTDNAGDVLALRCRHDAQGSPFALEERVISLQAVPEAAEQNFTSVPPGTWLLSQVPWNEAEHCIKACLADARTAKVLAVAPASACLIVERRTWRNGDIVTFVRMTFPGHLYHLVARFSAGRG